MFWKISQKIQESICVRSSLFNKSADCKSITLLKRDSGTGLFLSILPKFSEQIYGTRLPSGCFCLHYVVNS